MIIAMYHYVRDLKKSKYPKIKGLELELFKKQIKYILKNHRVMAMEELIEAVEANKDLEDNALLLTFDDGYKDHFEFVLPVLEKAGIKASFFPCVEPVIKKQVLQVNKIHFILASADEKDIISDIYNLLKKHSLSKDDFNYNKLAKRGRFDSKETMFIKRMLQKEIPAGCRQDIVDHLFEKHVASDQESFCQDLYMNKDELGGLIEKDMYVGVHGSSHCHLDTLSLKEQEKEIDFSLELLKEIGSDAKKWAIAYPYGNWSQSLLSLIKEKGCRVGLTTEPKAADLKIHNPFLLPRLDTNDLPYE